MRSPEGTLPDRRSKAGAIPADEQKDKSVSAHRCGPSSDGLDSRDTRNGVHGIRQRLPRIACLGGARPQLTVRYLPGITSQDPPQCAGFCAERAAVQADQEQSIEKRISDDRPVERVARVTAERLLDIGQRATKRRALRCGAATAHCRLSKRAPDCRRAAFALSFRHPRPSSPRVILFPNLTRT